MEWLRMVAEAADTEGADVEVPVSPVVTDARTDAVCFLFFDRQQTTSCFRPVVVVAIFVAVAV